MDLQLDLHRRGSNQTGDVPVGPILAAFLRSGMTRGQLARKMGWLRADNTRAGKELGLVAKNHGSKGSWAKKFLTYDLAVRLVEAIGADPYECGV